MWAVPLSRYCCSYGDRRHITQEEREQARAERVERVAKKRREGKSTRQIAEDEGVSHVQVFRDVKEATVTGVTVEPPHDKIIGKDKKVRPATKPKPPPEEKLEPEGNPPGYEELIEAWEKPSPQAREKFRADGGLLAEASPPLLSFFKKRFGWSGMEP
jgi:hypothetical protein